MPEVIDVKVPDIGDFDAVEVVEVLVRAGDRVEKDDSLITLESDKATMDVPAPAAGAVVEVKVKAGDQVHEGTVILTLESIAAGDGEKGEGAEAADSGEGARETEQAEPTDADEPRPEAAPGPGAALKAPPEEPSSPPRAPVPERPEPHPAEVAQGDFSRVYASPAVRRFARELGVDLRRVVGSGRNGRILRENVEAWVKETLASPTGRAGGVVAEIPAIDFSKFGDIERVALTRIQRISGPNLQRAWLSAPHVTQHEDADITDLEAFRQKHKALAKEQGFNLTPLAFIMKAAVATLGKFPRLNASLDPDGEHLILKRYFHFGIAVDTDEGLIVPVIRDVDQKGVMDLARELAEISQQARDRKLTPDQLRGASFTISSLGGIGGSYFSPIINVPEVAILGVSRHRWTPVWNGGEFEPRLMLPLSLSYDHRVIDGALAVRATTHLAAVLSDIGRLLL